MLDVSTRISEVSTAELEVEAAEAAMGRPDYSVALSLVVISRYLKQLVNDDAPNPNP